jgi:acetyltransferase-like isoleucine patch superfamily enzyme
MPFHEIKVPQFGVNEDSATVVELLISDYLLVTNGQRIAVLETSKSVFDLTSDENGYIKWFVNESDEVKTSQIIAVIATTVNELDYYNEPPQIKQAAIKATKKAQKLADKLHVSIDDIDLVGRLITTDDVQKYYDNKQKHYIALPEKVGLAIYGAGNAAEEIYQADPNPYAASTIFIDDYKAGEQLFGTTILSKQQFLSMFNHVANPPSIYIAIADGKTRVKLINEFTDLGFKIINIGTPKQYGQSKEAIGTHYKIGCIIGNNVSISGGCILDYNTTISHDCFLGIGVHIAPGATLGSSVKIGNYTIIGINASVATAITIGKNCIITIGTSVTQDIPDNSIVEGVPGKIIGMRK